MGFSSGASVSDGLSVIVAYESLGCPRCEKIIKFKYTTILENFWKILWELKDVSEEQQTV